MAETTLIQGRYELLEQIGRGGMGEVWRARDRALDRRVAVKCLKPLGNHHEEPVLKGLRERFRREARVAAGLQHRGITVVHDFGEDDGILFLVMELLEGRNLSEVLTGRDREPLPEPDIADIAAQVAAALDHTHRQGIIHRDLKPANVMLLDDGSVKICDFGIARLARDIGLATKLTTTGMAMGTPHYMSPEQISGTPADRRSDLYSLGCVLYELASGAPPFDLGDPWAILVGHRDTPPEPLRGRRPELSAALEELVLGLLAKDPEDRPTDVAQRTRRLAFAAARHTGARPLPVAPGVRGAARSAPGSGAASVPRLPPLPPPAGGTPAAGHLAALPPWARDMRAGVAVRAALRPPAPALAEGITGPWSAVTVATGGRPSPPGGVPAAVGTLAERHGAGMELGRSGRWAEALEAHDRVLAEREATLGPEHPDTLDSRHEAAASLGRLGRWEEALAGHRRVTEARARQLGPAHPATLDSRHQSAVALGRLGRAAEALEVYRALAVARAHAGGDGHAETLRARHGLGVSLGRLGRWEEALAEAGAVWTLRCRTLGDDHPDTLVSRREVAVALGWLGRWEEALGEYRPVRESRERVLGPTHPATLTSRNDEAHCLEQLGRHAEAAELHRAGAELRDGGAH
ncbi:serine/threonine-protein kinase [Streptomyces spiramenti]|uniref:non-specific serine/threonine protein kinase n=1 Tax=Streptomyces spiramenti TaxID=2720606 RepID=A0ABX1AQP1_9ACTN|nr:serine/threonine-protein kinase [Streptomyces spiramenti]NJP68476.1 protein kinase [Streptomyces spiramenti]